MIGLVMAGGFINIGIGAVNLLAEMVEIGLLRAKAGITFNAGADFLTGTDLLGIWRLFLEAVIDDLTDFLATILRTGALVLIAEAPILFNAFEERFFFVVRISLPSSETFVSDE